MNEGTETTRRDVLRRSAGLGAVVVASGFAAETAGARRAGGTGYLDKRVGEWEGGDEFRFTEHRGTGNLVPHCDPNEDSEPYQNMAISGDGGSGSLDVKASQSKKISGETLYEIVRIEDGQCDAYPNHAFVVYRPAGGNSPPV